ncbi:sensor histidine kinase [Muribaculum intestinale]|uniref:histidine kinase n=2 Tax=Muribaculum intestinale TaxID=1796646 RepID=A0A1B1SB44_9BACT|nr:ATP-binding protein [Muribaculum intestinale]ANU64013.1 ATP-binding protein [Muribaculum intestinale]ASB37891.1 ATP-binding protein [Muribaculum intestinale]PWB01172.1 ATP-binding protein [Muribaculum intestinale]PWB08297.1 ATP-binding protein [Muribaculum intestinale]QQR08624.1 ATP-binding protein [Muribaculum intestinale]
MANIYDMRRYGTVVFLLIAVGLAVLFLCISDNIVKKLAEQERQRMEIWADATREIANPDAASDNIDFLLSIIQSNRNIPVLLTDDEGNILDQRNFDLPEPPDTLDPLYISPVNQAFLNNRLNALRNTSKKIVIDIPGGESQYLYYEDSRLLRMLGYYPYIQVVVMLVFVVLVYFAVISTKKAEQNKVWVGLTKETAHQLGTPISSLMAWMELLESLGVDADMVKEMNKDVTRLSTIASRFGKVGSKPTLEPANLNTVVSDAASYMSTRISSRIHLTVDCCHGPLMVDLSDSLFQWVMENLIKNAVDAMEAEGSITVTTGRSDRNAWIEVADTGKGLPRNRFKTIFNPGYTTKKRGWGLGLALARRIIEQYHHGRIYVAASELGRGTTFRIELPLMSLPIKV